MNETRNMETMAAQADIIIFLISFSHQAVDTVNSCDRMVQQKGETRRIGHALERNLQIVWAAYSDIPRNRRENCNNWTEGFQRWAPLLIH